MFEYPQPPFNGQATTTAAVRMHFSHYIPQPMQLPHSEAERHLREGAMARESNNSTSIHSSIALLRERFRQLQRIKEMREEKELLRLITLAKAEQLRPVMSTTTPCDKPTWIFHPELLHPSRPLRHPTPYVHLDYHGGRYPSIRCFEDKSLSWADKANMHAPTYSEESVDVDTSLHL